MKQVTKRFHFHIKITVDGYIEKCQLCSSANEPFTCISYCNTTNQNKAHLFVAKVQDVGKFLHLLEAEVFLSLKSIIEYT